MCGICGIVTTDPSAPIPEERLRTMRHALLHRGPDDSGMKIGPAVGLGSRRLSILDLSERGRMPMVAPDGRFWIVHNGEVYNYRELRASLDEHRIPFRSNSDTEVLLHL